VHFPHTLHFSALHQNVEKPREDRNKNPALDPALDPLALIQSTSWRRRSDSRTPPLCW